MSINSAIEWTEATWNPVTGCTKVSPGCKYCYAERFAKRLRKMGSPNYKHGFKVSTHPHVLKTPFTWFRPRKVFVNSMSDIFHEKTPLYFIKKIFEVMRFAKQHQFQILTKRAERLLELDKQIDWPDNVWLGVSVENSDYLYRADCLRKVGAKIKFLSLEPLLGPVPELKLHNIDWVVVGGESGPGARPMRREWVLEVRNQCIEKGIPFFFKQWGGVFKKRSGRLLENRTWDEMPALSNVSNAGR